jgi:uncharacterized OB-fold protein
MAFLHPQPGPLPPSVRAEESAPFWEGLAAGELRYPRCKACGRADFPVAPHCRFCLEEELEWHVSAGQATLYSYTVVWRPVTPEFTVPYAPAVVLLEEGYPMMTNLVGLDSDEIRIDMPLRVAISPVGDGRFLPYFAPA